MKNVFRIAKTELRILFYSPVAWLLLIAFLVQTGITYFDQIAYFMRNQQMGGDFLNEMSGLVNRVFMGGGSVLGAVMKNLFIYVPLVTMALLSRETSSGTIKLLYSSPVKISEIVLGKYLSMVIFSLIMVLIAGIFLLMGMLHIENADGRQLLSASLGLFLVICAYASIGLFMSSLTTYQIAAVIATFVTIGALTVIGDVGQEYDFVRDLTYFLSIDGRADNMLWGWIISKDLVYFMIVISLFLVFTYQRLKTAVVRKSSIVNGLKITALIAGALLIGYISSRPAFLLSWDVTKNKSNTLTKKLQGILKDMKEGPVEIISYNNILNRYAYLGIPSLRNRVLSNWERYQLFKPDMNFKFVQYYDESLDTLNGVSVAFPGNTLEDQARQVIYGYKMRMKQFNTPEQMRSIVDIRPELNRFVMQVNYNNRSTFLRVFDDQITWPLEEEVGAAFQRLMAEEMPKAFFVTGHFERSLFKRGKRELNTIVNDKTYRNALINQGFDIDTLSLDDQELPGDAGILVLADPKTAFSTEAMSKLNRHIDSGGNMLIMGEPGKQYLLNPLLQKLGVQLMEGTVLEESKNFDPQTVQANISAVAAALTTRLLSASGEGRKIVMDGVTGISYSDSAGFTSAVLLSSAGDKTWLKKGQLQTDSGTIHFDAAEGDIKRSLPLGVSLSRKINGKEQRIVVVGDADFMSNGSIVRDNMKIANNELNTAIFSWLTYSEFPIDAPRPPSVDNRLLVSKSQLRIHKILLLWVLPCFCVISGIFLLIRRKRK